MSRQNNTSERNGLLWKTVRYIVRPLRIKSYSCSRLHAFVRKKRRRYQSSTPLQYGKYKNVRYFSFSLFSDVNLTGTTSFTYKNVHRFPVSVFSIVIFSNFRSVLFTGNAEKYGRKANVTTNLMIRYKDTSLGTFLK